MLPVNSGGHSDYQDFAVQNLLKHFPDPFAIPKESWDFIVKFWYLDLSRTDSIMLGYYPKTGKAATCFPFCLLPLAFRYQDSILAGQNCGVII